MAIGNSLLRKSRLNCGLADLPKARDFWDFCKTRFFVCKSESQELQIQEKTVHENLENQRKFFFCQNGEFLTTKDSRRNQKLPEWNCISKRASFFLAKLRGFLFYPVNKLTVWRSSKPSRWRQRGRGRVQRRVNRRSSFHARNIR